MNQDTWFEFFPVWNFVRKSENEKSEEVHHEEKEDEKIRCKVGCPENSKSNHKNSNGSYGKQKIIDRKKKECKKAIGYTKSSLGVHFDDSWVDYSSLNIRTGGMKSLGKNDKILKEKDYDNEKSPLPRSRSSSYADTFSNMSDFSNPEKIILDALDRIEDELDAQIPLPLRIRIFFEEHLFGWDHLTSDILGSLFYPFAMSVFQYYIFTLLWMDNSLFEEFMTICFNYICMFMYKEFASNMLDGESCWSFSAEWKQFVGEYHLAFKIIRFLYSLAVAIVTFRAIRRRRKVWFRTSYGSKAYLAESLQRRKEVQEVDRTTLLGRIRKNVKKRKNQILASRVKRKLSKASTRFDIKASRTNLALMEQEFEANRYTGNEDRSMNNAQDHMFVESVAHDQVYLPEIIDKIPYAHGGFFGASPFMLADPIWVDILRSLMPNVYVEVAKRIFAPAPKLIHWGENNPVVAAYGTAQDLEWMDSRRKHDPVTLEWDVFLDPVYVEKLQAALMDRNKLLRRLQIDYYSPFDENAEKIYHRAGNRNDVETLLIKVLERRDKELRRRTKQLVESMLIAHGTLSQLVLEQTGLFKKYVYARVKRARKTLGGGIFAHQWLAIYAEALKMGIVGKKHPMNTHSYLHGSSSESPVSPTLYSNSSNDSKIEDGDMNEIMIESKIDYHNLSKEEILFAKRNNAPTHGFENSLSNSPLNELVNHHLLPTNPFGPQRENTHSTSLDALANALCPSFSISESMKIINNILSYQAGFSSSSIQLGLILDLKSRHVPKEVWAMIVDILRQSNIRVEGVASFVPEEIRGITAHTYKPVPEVVFCHSAGDLQHLAHEGKIKYGDTVYFNAGSLIWDKGPSNATDLLNIGVDKFLRLFDADERKNNYSIESYARCVDTLYTSDLSMKSTIQAYKKKFDLQIGLYSQEFAIDDAAIQCIIQFINKNSHVYNLGLSWGGLNGITVANIQPGRFTSTDGLWNQRYAGRSWQSDLCPYNL